MDMDYQTKCDSCDSIKNLVDFNLCKYPNCDKYICIDCDLCKKCYLRNCVKTQYDFILKKDIINTITCKSCDKSFTFNIRNDNTYNICNEIMYTSCYVCYDCCGEIICTSCKVCNVHDLI